jgi:hypothetical protein
MTAQRRRRVQPLKKTENLIRKKRAVNPDSQPIEWGSYFFKGLTTLILIVNLIMILFMIRQCGNKAVPAESTVQPAPESFENARIEVLNGWFKVGGLASRFTDFLREREYNVVKTANYEESRNVRNCVIINWHGNNALCKKLASDLGLDWDSVLLEENKDYPAEATVVIGENYRSLKSWKIMEQKNDRL